MQRLQDTDAYILLEFKDAVKPHIGKPLTQELKPEIRRIAEPFYKRLLANGNTERESCFLLQAVFEDKQAG